jgi:hypothetical protein
VSLKLAKFRLSNLLTRPILLVLLLLVTVSSSAARSNYSALNSNFIDDSLSSDFRLLVNQNDIENLTNKARIRFRLDARELLVKSSFPQTIKVKAFFINSSGNEEIIQIQNITFLRRRAAKRIKYSISFPDTFEEDQLFIELFDSRGNNKARFDLSLNLRAFVEQQDLADADCDNDSFGDCQLQYILNSINYQIRPRSKSRTVVSKESSGKYTVSLPLVRADSLTIRRNSGPVSQPNFDTSALINLVSQGDFSFQQLKLAVKDDLGTVQEDGTLEFDGENLFITKDGERKQIGEQGPPGETGVPGVPGGGSGGSNFASLINLTAVDDPPSSPNSGDIYHDSSDALCFYSGITSAWTKIAGIGSCVAGTDNDPNAFDFVDQTALPSVTVNSTTLTITGFQNGPITVSGPGNPQYSLDSGAFTSAAGTIFDGQTLEIRMTSNATLGQVNTALINIGSVSDSWSVTSLLCPLNYAFIPGSENIDSFGNPDPTYAQGWCASQYEMTVQNPAVWTRDGAEGWDYNTSAGAGKNITSRGGVDSYPITLVTRDEAAAACANDFTLADATPITNGKLMTVYFWSNIAQRMADDGVNWSGGTPGSGNLSRGNSNSASLLAGIPEGTLATNPTGGSFYYTGAQGRAWRMGNGEGALYDFAGNAWEWYDDLHNNASGATTRNIDGGTIAFVHDNPNGPSNVTVLPSERATHDTTANGIGRIDVDAGPVIGGTVRSAFYGGDRNDTSDAGIFAAYWKTYNPASTRFSGVGFRCIFPVQAF